MDDPGLQMTRRSPFTGADDLTAVFDSISNVSSVPLSAAEDIGATPEIANFIHDGLLNASFLTPPPDTDEDLDDVENKLPGWSFAYESGTGITASWVAADDGGVVRFSQAAGAADDRSYLEQIVPARPSHEEAGFFTGLVFDVAFLDPSGSSLAEVWIEAGYLDADGNDVGAIFGQSQDLSSGGIRLSVSPGTGSRHYAPDEAAYVRVRFGLDRGGDDIGDTVSVDVSYAWITRKLDSISLVDQGDPDTYSDTTIESFDGELTISADTSILLEADALITTGKLRFEAIVQTSIGSTQNDYSPTGFGTATSLFIEATGADRGITGFSASGVSPGRTFMLINSGNTWDVVLNDTSVSSSAANRILCPNGTNKAIKPHGGVWITRGTDSSSNERWFVVAPA